MDGRQIDSLARVLGEGTSRRSVLALIGGAVASLVAQARGGLAQCANPEICGVDALCCEGFTCDEEALTCVDVVLCVGPDEPCESADECCSGSCVDSTCVEVCAQTGESCADSSSCCDGLICENSMCSVPSQCSECGCECSSTEVCCEGLDCADGICVVPVATPVDPGGDDDDDEEVGGVDSPGTGPVVTSLPNTGASEPLSDRVVLPGMAVGVAAAGLAISRWLRSAGVDDEPPCASSESG